MSRGRVHTIVVGGGPAGLATSRELARRGVPHQALERGPTIGHSWRNTYDSLTLPTGKHMSALPAGLLGLFVLRVVGQIVVMMAHPRWLPAAREWYAGLLAYRFLLPIQLLFIIVMTKMTVDVAQGGDGWATPRPGLGAVHVWLSFVYAGGMLVRFLLWLRRPPERRRAWIPIIFHVVLAAFLFVFASWLIAGR